MSESSSSSSNRASSGHASVADYLSDFQQEVEAAMPEENPGEPAMSQLVDIYVGRDNKRRIVLMIQTGPTTMTRVNYIMPVSRGGAFLFRLHGLQPHTPPTFATMAIPPAERISDVAHAWAAANNVAAWDAEIARVSAEEAATPENEQKRKRLMRNLLVYWRSMRTGVQNALRGISIRRGGNTSTVPVNSSNVRSSSMPRNLAGSSNSDPARRRTSSAARSATRRARRRRSTSNRSRRSSSGRRRISSNPA